MELIYEELNGFLLSCNLTFDKRRSCELPEEKLRLCFFADLQRHGVMQEGTKAYDSCVALCTAGASSEP